MTAVAITFEPMTPAHLEGALVLSRQAKWPHRLADWELSLAVSRGVVALEDGRVVGTILMTPYGEDGAVIGLVIVDEAMRGRGLGRKLMTEALTLAGERTCYLVATRAGLPLYEQMGFTTTGEVVQHQGVPLPIEAPADVSWAGASDHTQLVAIDRAAYGHDRSKLMQILKGRAKFAIIRDTDEVVSFATIRDFGRGQVIGPVAARNGNEARRLIAFLLAHSQGQFVRVDTNTATGLAPWLVERGLPHTDGGIAMVRAAEKRNQTTTGQHWTYALASQALG
ncbi:GNAT family N-acetyltransferase [Pelagibacterium halotolerans]|uniref:GNAT family N-acetyltransferase n=1 Tax=Pelagibacterium halotolerans TaxID=531813 RepID=UPI00384DC820